MSENRKTAQDVYKKAKDNFSWIGEVLNVFDKSLNDKDKSAIDELRSAISDLMQYEKQYDLDLLLQIENLQKEKKPPQEVETLYLKATAQFASKYLEFKRNYSFISIITRLHKKLNTGSTELIQKVGELNATGRQLANLESINSEIEIIPELKSSISKLEKSVDELNEKIISFYSVLVYILKQEKEDFEKNIKNASYSSKSVLGEKSEDNLFTKYFLERNNLIYYYKTLNLPLNELEQLDKQIDQANKETESLSPKLSESDFRLKMLTSTITPQNISDFISKVLVQKGIRVRGVRQDINERLLILYRDVVIHVYSKYSDKDILDIFSLMKFNNICFLKVSKNILEFDRGIADIMIHTMRTADIVAIINTVFKEMAKKKGILNNIGYAEEYLKSQLNSRFNLVEFQTEKKPDGYILQCTNLDYLINVQPSPRWNLDDVLIQIAQLGPELNKLEEDLSAKQMSAADALNKLYGLSIKAIELMQTNLEQELAKLIVDIIGKKRQWEIPRDSLFTPAAPSWLNDMLAIMHKPSHEFLADLRKIANKQNIFNNNQYTVLATEFFRLIFKSAEIYKAKSMQDFEDLNESLIDKMNELLQKMDEKPTLLAAVQDAVIISGAKTLPLSSGSYVDNAIKDGSLDDINKLLRKEIHANQFIENDPLIMVAARENRYNVVDLLIKHGANVNLSNSKNGKTALYIAIENENINLVKLLIDNNADITNEVKQIAALKAKPEIDRLLKLSDFQQFKP